MATSEQFVPHPGPVAAGHRDAACAGEPPVPGIVVGVDGSPQSRAALRWAVGQAELTGSPLRAVAVWLPPVVTAAPYGTGVGAVVTGGPLADPAAEADAARSVAAHRLDEAVAALPAEARRRVNRHVLTGDAAGVLLDAARDAAMLVLGNPGRGALAGAMTGSVALSCAHHAGCPVVLVPAVDG
ncbi:universal stress protein [Pseudonocardia saturnea]